MESPLAYNRDYALNAICPYFTMFPLEYPIQIIQKHKRQSPIVVDPFCGRGTTIYAARRLGLKSYGFDISPIAVAIAQAKLASTTLSDVMALARRLIVIEPKYIPQTPFFQRAYAPNTLRDICALREGLIRIRTETESSTLLRAAMLGCLHGPKADVVEHSGYFSNQMPRTFASKPDYSVRFWKKHGLVAPKISVLKVIERKLRRIHDMDTPKVGSFNRIKYADSRLAKPYKNINGRLLVITSPPYYGMRTYIQDQWLRNWFLGGPEEIDYETDIQIRHSGHDAFICDLARVWRNIRKRSNEVDLYVRFGTIPSAKSDARELLNASLEEAGRYKLIYTKRACTASEGRRQADQMRGDSEAAEEFDFHAIAS